MGVKWYHTVVLISHFTFESSISIPCIVFQLGLQMWRGRWVEKEDYKKIVKQLFPENSKTMIGFSKM